MTPIRQYPRRSFLSVTTVAEMMGVAVDTVGEWIRGGVIPAEICYQLRKGAPHRIDEQGFYAWLETTRIDKSDLASRDITATGDAPPPSAGVA